MTKLIIDADGKATAEEAYDAIPIKGMRAAIAASMMGSLHGTAQLTLHRQFDADPLVTFRKGFDQEYRPSLNDLILAATAVVLPKHPLVNATIDESTKTIRRWRNVHLGMAVGIEGGLVVPVVRDADKLSLPELSQETGRLGDAARTGRLGMKDLQGGTFTVTNLGHFGVDAFTPILNPPQVAILGVGRLNGTASTLSLTIDHRAVDGVPGAQFLQHLATVLENPTEYLGEPSP